jgi:hypothetical protein
MISGFKRARFARISCSATLKTRSGSELIAGTPNISNAKHSSYSVCYANIRSDLHTFSHETGSSASPCIVSAVNAAPFWLKRQIIISAAICGSH